MPTYPFERAKPAGWAFGEILTSAQMNAVDANAAQAADGLFWSDIAAARNWPYSNTISGAQCAAQGLAVSGVQALMWGVFATSDTVHRSLGGKHWRSQASVSALPTTSKAAVSNGAGLVIGGDNGSSDAKYAYSTSGVANPSYSAGTSSNSSTPVVNTVEWLGGSVSLYIGGLSNGLIETSPTGQTWTARTTPNSDARRSIFGNGSNLLLALTSASTDKYLTSPDAVNWTERSLPATSTSGFYGCYSAYAGKWFVQNAQTGALYKSSDGISWSTVTQSFPGSSGPMVAVGRVLCRASSATTYLEDGAGDVGVLLSVDEGATWRSGVTFAATSAGIRCFARSSFSNQLVLILDNDAVHLSAPMPDPAQPTYI